MRIVGGAVRSSQWTEVPSTYNRTLACGLAGLGSLFFLLFTPVAQSFRSGEDVTIKLERFSNLVGWKKKKRLFGTVNTR